MRPSIKSKHLVPMYAFQAPEEIDGDIIEPTIFCFITLKETFIHRNQLCMYMGVPLTPIALVRIPFNKLHNLIPYGPPYKLRGNMTDFEPSYITNRQFTI